MDYRAPVLFTAPNCCPGLFETKSFCKLTDKSKHQAGSVYISVEVNAESGENYVLFAPEYFHWYVEIFLLLPIQVLKENEDTFFSHWEKFHTFEV